MFKVCTKCNKEKESAEFYKDGRRVDGLRSQCKECTNKDNSSRERKYKETRRKYRESQHGKTKSSAAHRKAYVLHKDKILKQNASWRQTKKGRLSSYKRSAISRKIDWDITDEEFFSFWQKSCTYCGDEIETIGLDRIDSQKGYSLENLTSCCSSCNKMKLDLTKEDFLEKIKQIITFIGV